MLGPPLTPPRGRTVSGLGSLVIKIMQLVKISNQDAKIRKNADKPNDLSIFIFF
jgi:hypothetical protein